MPVQQSVPAEMLRQHLTVEMPQLFRTRCSLQRCSGGRTAARKRSHSAAPGRVCGIRGQV